MTHLVRPHNGSASGAHKARRSGAALQRWPQQVITVEPTGVLTRETPQALRAFGIELVPQSTGISALLSLSEHDKTPVVLVPSSMADVDPVAFTEAVTAWYGACVLLGVTETETDTDLIYRVLNAGARALVPLPFTAPQLSSALSGLHERGELPTRPNGSMAYGIVEVDLGGHVARVAGSAVDLSAAQFMALCHLAANAPRIVPVEELLEELDSSGPSEYDVRKVRALMSRLRHRLDATRPSNSVSLIENVRQVGYRLRDG